MDVVWSRFMRLSMMRSVISRSFPRPSLRSLAEFEDVIGNRSSWLNIETCWNPLWPQWVHFFSSSWDQLR